MGDTINLRTVRKRFRREQAATEADARRLAHGQPKRARALAEARKAKADRDLDGHRLKSGDAL